MHFTIYTPQINDGHMYPNNMSYTWELDKTWPPMNSQQRKPLNPQTRLEINSTSPSNSQILNFKFHDLLAI